MFLHFVTRASKPLGDLNDEPSLCYMRIPCVTNTSNSSSLPLYSLNNELSSYAIYYSYILNGNYLLARISSLSL